MNLCDKNQKQPEVGSLLVLTKFYEKTFYFLSENLRGVKLFREKQKTIGWYV